MGRLLDLIEASGLKLSSVAVAVGTRVDFIERVDQGRQYLPINIAVAIASAINVDVPTVVNAVSLITNITDDRAAVNPFPPIASEQIRVGALVKTTSVIVPTPVLPPQQPEPQIWIGGSDNQLHYVTSAGRVLTSLANGSGIEIGHAGGTSVVVDNGVRSGHPGEVITTGLGNRSSEFLPVWIADGRIARVPNAIHVGTSVIRNFPRDIVQDDEGYLWASFTNEGSPNGFSRFDPSDPYAVGMGVVGPSSVRDCLFTSDFPQFVFCMDQSADDIFQVLTSAPFTVLQSVDNHVAADHMCYDSNRKRIVCPPGGAGTVVATFDPTTLVRTNLVTVDALSTFHHGCTFDPVRDLIWTCDDNGDRVLGLDPDTADIAVTLSLGAGGSPEGILYEPTTVNYDGLGGDTGDKLWVYRRNPSRLDVYDPDTLSLEDSFLLDAEDNVHLTVRTQALDPVKSVLFGGGIGSGISAITPAAAASWANPTDPETVGVLAGHWKAGTHNTTSGSEVTTLIDLSGNGRDLPKLSGTGGIQVASDAIFNGEPSIIMTSAGLEQYSSAGAWGWSDLIADLSSFAGSFTGDGLHWFLVFSLTSQAAVDATPWYPSGVEFLCGGFDLTGVGMGVAMAAVNSTGSDTNFGGIFTDDTFQSRAEDGPVSAAVYNTPRCLSLRVRSDDTLARVLSLSSTSQSEAVGAASAASLSDRAGDFYVGPVAASTALADWRFAELFCFKHCEAAEITDHWRDQYIRPIYGDLL